MDIICVYNDKQMFEKTLVSSLKKQKSNHNIRLLSINNENTVFTSMAKAYNAVIPYIKAEYVVFLHQDIRLENAYVIEKLLSEVSQLDKSSVWGVAGVKYPNKKTLYCCQDYLEVDTLDECFFGMKKERFEQLLFNESICNDWHMYAVEMCIHNQLEKGKNYIIQADVSHLSMGCVTKKYIRTLYNLIDFYKENDLKYVWTTCAKVEIRKAYRLYIMLYMVKHEVLNRIIRPFIRQIKLINK